MPFGMGGPIRSVVLGNNVYVGGGSTGGDCNELECTVMVYDITTDQYSTLPQYDAMYFAMTSLNSQFVLAGGYNIATSKSTNQTAVLESVKWTQPYQPYACSHWY